MNRTRVLIAERYPLLRQGVRAALADLAQFQVVAEVDTAAAALRALTATRPDLVLASTVLPDHNGTWITRRIKEALPRACVVLLAPDDTDEELFGALQAGAMGLLRLDVTPRALVEGLRRVVRGESLLADTAVERPAVATRVLRQFHDQAEQAADLEPLLVPLSGREMEILEQIARGNSNKLIARELAISDHTVKNHVTSILRKLAVNDRTGAVVLAMRQGWIQT